MMTFGFHNNYAEFMGHIYHKFPKMKRIPEGPVIALRKLQKVQEKHANEISFDLSLFSSDTVLLHLFILLVLSPRV